MAVIQEGWVEIQTGLYLEEQTRTISGRVYTFRYLHSADGYCFYDTADEIYDADGNLIPDEDVLPEQRMYYQWMALAIQMSAWTYEQLNAKFISVPVDDGYEIVGNKPPVEEM